MLPFLCLEWVGLYSAKSIYLQGPSFLKANSYRNEYLTMRFFVKFRVAHHSSFWKALYEDPNGIEWLQYLYSYPIFLTCTYKMAWHQYASGVHHLYSPNIRVRQSGCRGRENAQWVNCYNLIIYWLQLYANAPSIFSDVEGLPDVRSRQGRSHRNQQGRNHFENDEPKFW